MYHQQAMRETRQKQLVESMEQVYSAHYKEEFYKRIKIANMQCGKPKLQATHDVNEKEQLQGDHNEVTYAPVIRWVTIQLHMTSAHYQQLTYKTAYICNINPTSVH